MEFTYDLIGTGWAKARIAQGDDWAVLTASYISDALGNLLGVVLALLDGADEARCAWDEEPGEYRWLLRRSGTDVAITVIGFPELWSEQPDSEGTVLFSAAAPLSLFATAVADGADRLLAEHGAEGYEQRWVDAPFPSDLLASIRERLALT
jgi:hypothetical protein